MKVTCSRDISKLPALTDSVLPVLLYGRADTATAASAGAAIVEDMQRAKLCPDQRAIDLLSLALSVVTADLAIPRSKSPDGWTRQISLSTEVSDAEFWSSKTADLETMLRFLTTDIWSLTFTDGGFRFERPSEIVSPDETCVALLSGGADSLVGVLDLVENGNSPFVVSQTVHGDGEKQGQFAATIGNGLRHLQMNHNAKYHGDGDRDQRARSLIFLAYGVLAATATSSYRDGGRIPLYACENGFISVNPPLTEARIGSLSTRTTHPIYIARFQKILDDAGLNVEIRNPYRHKTKGEMFAECKNQKKLRKLAHVSTSCSRFRTFGLEHCGRCVPCMIRRAAFHRWGVTDQTSYKYSDLHKADADHAQYDDVRSAHMAIQVMDSEGGESLIGATLSSPLIEHPQIFYDVVSRGIGELKSFLNSKSGR